MSRRAALTLSSIVILSIAAACSSGGDGPNGATYGAPDGSTSNNDGGNADGGLGKQESDITFAADTAFAKRDCTLTIAFTGSAGEVKLAGEFTDWATSPMTLTQTGAGYSVTLTPSERLVGGVMYGYKLIVDNNWQLDPANTHQKIIGGLLNSALVMPNCAAGPELTSEKTNATAAGDMKVRIHTKSASDGVAPAKVLASLDRGLVPAGTWTTTKDGNVDFAFSALEKGKHTLSLRTIDAKGREADPIDLPFWVEDEAFDYRDGILYMVMLDRFANGDKSIDRNVPGVDYDADWHGGDLIGAKRVLDSGYFDKLGVRTIWLSPVNAQTDKLQLGDGNQKYSAYHGYWPTKARAVEPRLGGDQALRDFIGAAHKRGIRVVIDLINNQVHEDHEYTTKNASWFRHTCQCGDDANNCGWSQRPFDCQFEPYLPDIDWTNSGAETQFISDAVNWISEYDLDGFRVDAVKHVEPNSIYDMRAALSRRFEQGGGRVFMVGETAVGEGDHGSFFGVTFNDGFQWVDSYVGPNALDGQFDFPTLHNMSQGLVDSTQAMNDIENQMQKSLTRYRPGNLNVRFLNGHDNRRIASLAAQDPKLGCSWSSGCRGDQLPPSSYTDPVVYQRLKRGITVLYSMPGVPYLYMGDEVAFPGGDDPDMRRNMKFEESALSDLQMTQSGASLIPLTAQQTDLRDWVRKLGAIRAGSPALRRGDRVTLLGTDADFWIYAYKTATSAAIVAVNRGAAGSRTVAAAAFAGGSFSSPLGTGSASMSGSNLTVTLGAGEAAIFTR